jgi:hypothetical protein
MESACVFLIVSHSAPLCIAMKKIKTTCAECKIEFEKSTSEYNRSERLGKRHFCSCSCSVTCGNKEMSPERKTKCGNQIRPYIGNRQDKYSGFKYYITKCKSRIKKFNYNIDVFYLKTLWESQNGICPYTGIKMILPKNTKEHMTIHSLKKASLDRIDSSKGYIDGNVEFVCMAVNYAKNSFSKQNMKEFIAELIEKGAK